MLTEWQVLCRLVVAGVLSGLIGFEREFHGRAAGFRTHILVCIGSTLVMLTSIHMFDMYSARVACDPGRIAAGVVTGIGFLGAGTIMRFKSSVRGLTTAASLWVVSGLGLAVGSGMYFAALVTTIITLVALLIFSRIERALIRKDWYKVLTIESEADIENLTRIRSALGNFEVEIKDFDMERTKDGTGILWHLSLKLATSRNDHDIISEISDIEGVRSVKWELV
jgi:putative Mg2+ transporter-C (MgtC) family protein